MAVYGTNLPPNLDPEFPIDILLIYDVYIYDIYVNHVFKHMLISMSVSFCNYL